MTNEDWMIPQSLTDRIADRNRLRRHCGGKVGMPGTSMSALSLAADARSGVQSHLHLVVSPFFFSFSRGWCQHHTVVLVLGPGRVLESGWRSQGRGLSPKLAVFGAARRLLLLLQPHTG